MKLRFQKQLRKKPVEKVVNYIDGIDLDIDADNFVKEYLLAHHRNQTISDLANTLGISHIQVSYIECKLHTLKVKLPLLKVNI